MCARRTHYPGHSGSFPREEHHIWSKFPIAQLQILHRYFERKIRNRRILKRASVSMWACIAMAKMPCTMYYCVVIFRSIALKSSTPCLQKLREMEVYNQPASQLAYRIQPHIINENLAFPHWFPFRRCELLHVDTAGPAKATLLTSRP